MSAAGNGPADLDISIEAQSCAGGSFKGAGAAWLPPCAAWADATGAASAEGNIQSQ